ncbi:AAA domain (dynein-related subfamily) [Musa troglodytarum]|uniref:AAA domain (Dynein-related subfamily) n=1 Tax=Musa troglodytarum TaxID=320322 RepID=A0A9E7K8W9_9LILI|nr:AAA domain (dynein-related subfamily) [Musa troglodytarum]
MTEGQSRCTMCHKRVGFQVSMRIHLLDFKATDCAKEKAYCRRGDQIFVHLHGNQVLIEAVENHMPQVIVIDEIGTKLEAVAASTIAQRGIQLVATAHGVTIENLIMNPSLEMLVGGIQSVTLGDEEASRRGVQKTVLERKGHSTFTFGRSPNFEIRKMDIEESTVKTLPLQKESLGDIFTLKEEESKVENDLLTPSQKLCNNIPTIEFKEKVLDISHEVGRDFHLFVYGIMESSVLQALKQLGIDEMIETTDNISEADAFLALSSKLKKNSQIQAVAKSRDIPIFVTKSTSLAQITKAVGALVNEHANVSKYRKAEHEATSSEMVDALEEARLAIEQIVIPQGKSVQLLPRPPRIIPVQIDLIKKHKLKWEMVGQEPGVHLRIFPLPLQAGIGGKKSVDQVVDENIELDDLRSFGGTESSQSCELSLRICLLTSMDLSFIDRIGKPTLLARAADKLILQDVEVVRVNQRYPISCPNCAGEITLAKPQSCLQIPVL